MDPGPPFLPGLYALNSLGVSFLPPSCSSTAFQHGFAFASQKAELFLDLAEGWRVHPEHSAATSDARNLLGIYSQREVLPTLHV